MYARFPGSGGGALWKKTLVGAHTIYEAGNNSFGSKRIKADMLIGPECEVKDKGYAPTPGKCFSLSCENCGMLELEFFLPCLCGWCFEAAIDFLLVAPLWMFL